MSIRAMHWAMHLAPADLTPTQRHVLLILCDHVDDNTGCAWPSVRRVATMTGLSHRSVQRALHDLVAAELIAPVPEARDGGAGRSIRYRWLADPGIPARPSTPVRNPVDNPP